MLSHILAFLLVAVYLAPWILGGYALFRGIWSLMTGLWTCLAIVGRIAPWFLGAYALFLVAWFYLPPRSMINLYKRLFSAPYVRKAFFYKEGVTKKVIALSIDDSPSANTTAIVNLLDMYLARATFFVIGSYAKARPDVMHNLACYRQHEMANHGWSTWAAAWYDCFALHSHMMSTRHEMVNAMVDAGRPVRMRTHAEPDVGLCDWYRPGSAFLSKGVMNAATQQLGYRVVLGDVYPMDAHVPWPWYCARYVLRHVQPGSVIVLHDRARTLQTLELILPELKRQGYEIVTLSDLFGAMP
jgi:peptidoglycan/xylan/chitin deacetylase (PgdA/CDA1 family)